MQLKSGIKILLPFIVVAIFLSLLVIKEIVLKNNKVTIVSNTTVQTNSSPIPINPLPENIQILGETDTATQSSQNQKEQKEQVTAFDTLALYNLINSYRDENNLNKLFINKLLEDSSQRKLTDMIDAEYFKHSDTNNNESWYLFQAAGYQYKFAGENLSTGNNTPWKVFEAWQKSPAHNEQLLKSEYLDMGLAVNCEEYKIGRNASCLVVLHLGTR